MNKYILYSVSILVLITGIVYFLMEHEQKESENTNQDTYISYKSSEYSPEFIYPKTWGAVEIQKGNTTCPEEDTYRTADTLHVFDWEYAFAEIKLPDSESMIRTGIRTYELDPKKLNDCGDDFLLKIARKEMDTQSISSFILQPITNKNGLSGTYNPEASRLNTEARRQYTFFIPRTSGTIYIIQSYMSFVPYFGSPELQELEQTFDGDMSVYLSEGKTSITIRNYFDAFTTMSESLHITGE